MLSTYTFIEKYINNITLKKKNTIYYVVFYSTINTYYLDQLNEYYYYLLEFIKKNVLGYKQGTYVLKN